MCLCPNARSALITRFIGGFGEFWDQFDGIIQHGQDTGETTVGGRQQVLLQR
jgi:hypothetical protein